MEVRSKIEENREGGDASDISSLQLRLLTILEGALAERQDNQFLQQIGIADFWQEADNTPLCQAEACFSIKAEFVVDSEGNIVASAKEIGVTECVH